MIKLINLVELKIYYFDTLGSLMGVLFTSVNALLSLYLLLQLSIKIHDHKPGKQLFLSKILKLHKTVAP